MVLENGEHLMPAIGAARCGWHCAVKDGQAGFMSKNTDGITGSTSDLIAVNFTLAVAFHLTRVRGHIRLNKIGQRRTHHMADLVLRSTTARSNFAIGR